MKKIFALTLLSAAVIAGGCSSDDDDAGGETDGMETAGTATGGTATGGTATGGDDGGMAPMAAMLPAADAYDPAMQDPVPTLNLLETASGVDALSSLVGAAGNCPDVVALLGNADARLTVFAPSNDAFAAEAFTTASAAPDFDACAVISNHVIADTVAGAADLGGANVGASAMAAGGGSILLGTGADAGSVTVNGANVTMANVYATNGVAHVIDAVLLPAAPTMGGETAGDGGDDGGDEGGATTGGGEAGANATAIQSSGANFATAASSFFGSLDAFDDAATNQWTVFVPTDAAAADPAAINVRAHIYTEGGLDPAALAATPTLVVSDANGNNTYQIGMAGTDVTVDGNVVTPLSNNGVTYIYSIDGTLGN